MTCTIKNKKLITGNSSFMLLFFLLTIRKIKNTFIKKLMMIAQTPSVITRSLKKGTATTWSAGPVITFFNSIHLKNTNSRKAILQMKVKRDKKAKSLISKIAIF